MDSIDQRKHWGRIGLPRGVASIAWDYGLRFWMGLLLSKICATQGTYTAHEGRTRHGGDQRNCSSLNPNKHGWMIELVNAGTEANTRRRYFTGAMESPPWQHLIRPRR